MQSAPTNANVMHVRPRDLAGENWTNDVANCVAALTNAETALQAEIEPLRKLSTPGEIAASQIAVTKHLKAVQHQLKEFKATSDEQDSDADSRYILDLHSKHATIVNELQVALRRAVLVCEGNIERQGELDRRKLLEGASERMELRKRQLDQQNSAHKSQQFTEALRRTHGAMDDAVKRSKDAYDVLTNSTRSLRETSGDMRQFSQVTDRSGKLISKQAQRERTNFYLVLVCLAFFLAVCCYVIQRRLRGFFGRIF